MVKKSYEFRMSQLMGDAGESVIEEAEQMKVTNKGIEGYHDEGGKFPLDGIKMKKGVYVINTSRGQLINTQSLINGLKSGKIGAAGLDVYEEETSLFFEDYSDEIIHDDTLSTLISMPNVLVIGNI